MTNNIFVLGSTGMAGHLIYTYLKQNMTNANVIGMSRSKSLCTDLQCDVRAMIHYLARTANTYDTVINCIGMLNKLPENSETIPEYIEVNALFPWELASLGLRVIQLSTDCVFEPSVYGYHDDAKPNATSVYGKSKALGELTTKANCLTIRNSIFGPAPLTRQGFFDWVITFPQNETMTAYPRWYWDGMTTLQLAKCIHEAIQKRTTGLLQYSLMNLVNKSSIIDEINEQFNLGLTIKREMAPLVKREIIGDSLIKLPTIEQQIAELYEWMMNNKPLYENAYPQVYQ